MKCLAVFSLLLLASGGGAAWAASKAPERIPTAAPSPFVLKKANGLTSANVMVQNMNVHGLNVQMRVQMKLIAKELKSGKLTRAQAEGAWKNIKGIRKNEVEYFHKNGRKEITNDQKNELNTQLEKNADAL